MWSLIPQNYQLLIILGLGWLLGSAIESGYLLLFGRQLSDLQTISFVAAVLGGAGLVLAQVGWRWLWSTVPMLQPLTFPDLNGKWEGRLVSTWIDDKGVPTKPISATLRIYQGLFHISVTMKTTQSDAQSRHCHLEANHANKCYRVYYSYENQARAQFEPKSAAHRGYAWLELDYDRDQNCLKGSYFTSRKTTGDMEFKRKGRR